MFDLMSSGWIGHGGSNLELPEALHNIPALCKGQF